MTNRAGLALATALVAVVGAGCSAGSPVVGVTPAARSTPAAGSAPPGGTAAAASAPADLPVAVFRNRGDDLAGIFSVKVSNDGADEVHIRSVTLRTAAYQTLGAVDVDTTVAAGLRVDLRVPVGQPVCDAGADAPSATVDLVTDAPDDPAGEVKSSREVTAEELVAANHRECAVAAARAASNPTLVGPWVPGSDAAGRPIVDGTLRLTVPDDAPGDVVITAMQRTVLFVPVGTTFPVTVSPGGSTDIDVRLATGRCDPHAVAEATAKYGFVFPVRVTVAGGEEVVVPTPITSAEREPLFELLDLSCGLSS